MPPLSERVVLSEYVNKIYQKALLFEAWKNDILVGLIACYANDLETKIAFLTSVSVLAEYRSQGIAGKLMENCITQLKNNNFSILKLTVNVKNAPAIHLYQKYGFVETSREGDRVSMEKTL